MANKIINLPSSQLQHLVHKKPQVHFGFDRLSKYVSKIGHDLKRMLHSNSSVKESTTYTPTANKSKGAEIKRTASIVIQRTSGEKLSPQDAGKIIMQSRLSTCSNASSRSSNCSTPLQTIYEVDENEQLKTSKVNVYRNEHKHLISPHTYLDWAKQYWKQASNILEPDSVRIEAYNNAKNSATYAVALGVKDAAPILWGIHRDGIQNMQSSSASNMGIDKNEADFWLGVTYELSRIDNLLKHGSSTQKEKMEYLINSKCKSGADIDIEAFEAAKFITLSREMHCAHTPTLRTVAQNWVQHFNDTLEIKYIPTEVKEEYLAYIEYQSNLVTHL